MLSFNPSFCKIRRDNSHFTLKRPLLTQNAFALVVTIRSEHAEFVAWSTAGAQNRLNRVRGNHFCNGGHGGASSLSGTPAYRKWRKSLLRHLLRKTRARGFTDECQQYNNSSVKRAIDNIDSTSCTINRGRPTRGTTSNTGQDAFTQIIPFPKYRNEDKRDKETP